MEIRVIPGINWDSGFVSCLIVEGESLLVVVSDFMGGVCFGDGGPDGVWIVGFKDGASGG